MNHEHEDETRQQNVPKKVNSMANFHWEPFAIFTKRNPKHISEETGVKKENISTYRVRTLFRDLIYVHTLELEPVKIETIDKKPKLHNK